MSFVWAMKCWGRYEPDEKYRTSEPSPLLYLRWWLNADTRIRFSRAEIDYERRLLHGVGGPALRGIYLALCEYAGDRAHLRGLLMRPDGQPAAAAEIAETMYLDADEVAWALRLLSGPEIGLVEKVELEDVPRWLAALEALLKRRQGDSGDRSNTPTGGPTGSPATDGGATVGTSVRDEQMPDDHGPAADLPAGPPSRPPPGQPEQPDGVAMTVPASQTAANLNGNANPPAGAVGTSLALAGCGNSGNGIQEAASSGTPNVAARARGGNAEKDADADGDGHHDADADGYGDPDVDVDADGHADGDVDGESDADADRKLPSTGPGATGRRHAPPPPSPGPDVCSGSRSRQPAARPSTGPGATGRQASPPAGPTRPDDVADDGSREGRPAGGPGNLAGALNKTLAGIKAADGGEGQLGGGVAAVAVAGGPAAKKGKRKGRVWNIPPIAELAGREPRPELWGDLAKFGVTWPTVQAGPRAATRFGVAVYSLLGFSWSGDERNSEVAAFAERWSLAIVQDWPAGLLLFVGEKLLELAADLGDRRMKAACQPREGQKPVNYRAVWMSEGRRLIAAATAAWAESIEATTGD